MNKKFLGIAVGLMALVILTTSLVGMTYAKKPTVVSGHQEVMSVVPLDSDPKGKSDNVVSIAMYTVSWTGDIEGVAVYEGNLMVHSMDPLAINIHEKIHFDEVTVQGKSGSLTLQVCANLGRGVDAGFRWTIIEGTGELANIHGNGLYWRNFVTGVYDYEGQVHFDP